MAPRNPARSPKKTAKPKAKARRATADVTPLPRAPAGPTKKRKVLDCIVATFSPPTPGPDLAPKDKWPDAARWDAKANDIAKCIKRKFPSADQVALKELLLSNHTTAIKTIVDRLVAKLT
jgi:hypothetical protein